MNAGGFAEIDVDELASCLAEGVRLVDVREPHEYVGGHVPGAVLVPLSEVPDRVTEFGDEGDTVYVICQAGGRSARACEFVRTLGINTVNVIGGTGAWIISGRPVVMGEKPT